MHMIGEMTALGCAFMWALSSVIIKSQIGRFNALFANTLRCVVGAIVFVLLSLVMGRLGELFRASAISLLSLGGASICVFVVGDTMFYHSMGIIGVSRALPISCCSPIFTLAIAVAFFGKSVSMLAAGGFIAVVAGVYFVASVTSTHSKTEKTVPVKKGPHLFGVILAIAAAICWAAGTNLLNVGVEETDVVVANAFRLMVAAVPLTVLVLRREGGFPKLKNYGWKNFFLLLLGCAVGGVAATILYVIAVKHAGASKAAVLSSVAPLFAVPLSFFMLKERITVRLSVGVMLSVIGIWLVLMH